MNKDSKSFMYQSLYSNQITKDFIDPCSNFSNTFQGVLNAKSLQQEIKDIVTRSAKEVELELIKEEITYLHNARDIAVANYQHHCDEVIKYAEVLSSLNQALEAKWGTVRKLALDLQR